jgi:hypothetical protein
MQEFIYGWPFFRSIIFSWILVFASVSQAQYSPEHPKVATMINRAVNFLEKNPESGSIRAGNELTGGEILAGYTILLATADPAHPKVKRAERVAQEVIQAAVRGDRESHIVYTVSVSCVLLAAIDPDRFRRELEAARDWFVRIQRQFGGFGYLEGMHPATGDTSQVQYVVLAFWSLNKVGVSIPVGTLENTLRFLMLTQDPSGSWGYQGIVSQGGSLSAQIGVSKSLGTAGIGALLMTADILRLLGSRAKDEDGIPSVFQRVDNRTSLNQGSRVSLKRSDIDGAIKAAFNYQDNSPPQGLQWYYYWRYAQERYESFRELIDAGRAATSSWYDTAVDEFASTQEQDGSWRKGQGTGAYIDTAFVALFLMRSTRKALGTLDEGIAFGGYELPSDVTRVRMVGERLMSDAEASVENLLSLMESEEQRLTEGMLARDLNLSQDPDVRSAEIARLRRLLKSRNPTARRLAARLLGRSDQIEVAADLISALTDPDPHVPTIAEEGLRLLSRRLNSVNVRVDATDEAKWAAERYWKEWYLGLRPDHVFPSR